MSEPSFSFGEEVVLPWGISEVHATVVEVYGPPGRRSVVVELTPDLSDFVVAEPTTLSVPMERLRSAAPAA